MSAVGLSDFFWLEFKFLFLIVFLWRIMYAERSFSRLHVSVHILSGYRIFRNDNTEGIDIQVKSASNRNCEVHGYGNIQR